MKTWKVGIMEVEREQHTFQSGAVLKRSFLANTNGIYWWILLDSDCQKEVIDEY